MNIIELRLTTAQHEWLIAAIDNMADQGNDMADEVGDALASALVTGEETK